MSPDEVQSLLTPDSAPSNESDEEAPEHAEGHQDPGENDTIEPPTAPPERESPGPEPSEPEPSEPQPEDNEPDHFNLFPEEPSDE